MDVPQVRYFLLYRIKNVFKTICSFPSIYGGKCSGRRERGELSEKMWQLWNQLLVTTQYFYGTCNNLYGSNTVTIYTMGISEIICLF